METSAVRVRDEASFIEMRGHILEMYKGVNVTNSFLDGGYFDCVTVETQPSLRGGTVAAPPTPSTRNTIEHASESSVLPSKLQQGLADEYGNALYCTPGTIPMHRCQQYPAYISVSC